MLHYILDGKAPIPALLLPWAAWFKSADRTVEKTAISEDVEVSTVFLGLDHSFGDGPPLLFETMVFGGEHDQDQWRYSTWAEAEAGHDKAVAMLKEGAVFIGVDHATGADKTVIALMNTQAGDCNQLAGFILFSRGSALGFTPYVYACEEHLALLKEHYDIAEVRAVPSPTQAKGAAMVEC